MFIRRKAILSFSTLGIWPGYKLLLYIQRYITIISKLGTAMFCLRFCFIP